MKIIRAIAAIAFFAAISAASVAAQPKPTTTPTPTRPSGPASSGPAATGSTTGNVPETKVALLYTDAFGDEKTGIQRLTVALKKLETEFQPSKTEMENIAAQIEKMTNDLQKASPVQDPKVSAQQQDAIEQKKRDLKRKQEDAETAFQKRYNIVIGPVLSDIRVALDAFAKAHGITLILDPTKMEGIIVSADGSADITKAFITEFNSKNPATASLTPQP